MVSNPNSVCFSVSYTFLYIGVQFVFVVLQYVLTFVKTEGILYMKLIWFLYHTTYSGVFWTQTKLFWGKNIKLTVCETLPVHHKKNLSYISVKEVFKLSSDSHLVIAPLNTSQAAVLSTLCTWKSGKLQEIN